jgi:hypothetical protein
MPYPINIIQELVLEKDFLIINLEFGKKKHIAISNLTKLYIRFPKKKGVFYYVLMAVVIGFGIFGCMYFTQKVVVLFVALFFAVLLINWNTSTIYEMHFFLKNGSIIKVYLPCNLKSDAICIIQNLRKIINSNHVK